MNTSSNYIQIKELDSGKHGKIFLVKNTQDDKEYAKKRIKIKKEKKDHDEEEEDEGDEEEEDIESVKEEDIEREIEIMEKVTKDNHPNIIRFITHYKGNKDKKDKKYHYLIYEKISGKNLQKLKNEYDDKNQNIEQYLIIIILRGVLNGLIYLNEKNILHRDISPDNIMITDDNEIKIIDFGLSKNYENDIEHSVVGKQECASPEINKAKINKKDKTIYDTKNDIFSLGATMFYLMTCKYPFCKPNKKIYMRNDEYIDPDIYNEQLINIIMGMLEEDPNKRPTCLEVNQQMVDLIGNRFMDIKYKIKNNDIKLVNYYTAKKTAFFSVILSLSNIEKLKQFFKQSMNKKKYLNKKENEEKDSNIVIGKFIKILYDCEDPKKGFNSIKKFILEISEKILIFKEYKKIMTPKLILRILFDYFYFNIANLFVYNNENAFRISEILQENKNNNPIYKEKVNELIEKYSNPFADFFAFLVHKKNICPKCNNIIEEKYDIEYDIEFYSKESIKDLSKEYFKSYNYNNIDKNFKMCEKCFSMTLNEEKSILIAPRILTLHFDCKMDYMIEKQIEIKEKITNKKIIYKLFSIIFVEELNNNDYRYNVSILNESNNTWKYIKEEKKSLSQSFVALNQIMQKNEYICTAFYKMDNFPFP